MDREVKEERSKRVTLRDTLKDRKRSANGIVNFDRGRVVVIGAEREMNKGRRKVGMLKNMVQP